MNLRPSLTDPRLLRSFLDWLADEEIAEATPFEDWRPISWNTPDVRWHWNDRPRNAWHCRALADALRVAGNWIGAPAEYRLRERHKLYDGNHRVRATQYLWRIERRLIFVPVIVTD